MANTIPISTFIQEIKLASVVLLDARSEGEYDRGHIPGALNLPLLNNDERVIVGTTYKQQGREEAVRAGFDLVGKKFVEFIDKAKLLSPNKQVYIYCWRGGMRSNIMAWVLNMAGFKVTLLKGGYKEFRNWALAQFNIPKKVMVLGGPTGSGKTEVLMEIKKSGQQFIDLENLAHHKGSAFGGLGNPPQPTQETFENNLAWQWSEINADEIVWLENESRKIGKSIIPDGVYNAMRDANIVQLERDYEIRKARILNEYGHFAKEQLAEKTQCIAKRLGGLNLKNALEFLTENDLNNWVDILMTYYDKTYANSNEIRDTAKSIVLNAQSESDCSLIAQQIISITNEKLKNNIA